MPRLSEAGAQLADINRRIEAAEHELHDTTPLEQQAKQAANALRASAVRARDQVYVRVTRTGDKITVSMGGPSAGKYYSRMDHELRARMPTAMDELEARVVEKIG